MKKLCVAVTDWTFPDLAVEESIVQASGFELVGRQSRSEEELMELVAEADCVINQFSKLTPRVIAGMKRARAIVRYGIGVDSVDLEAARGQGIPVCNVPDYCINEVADQTLAFILGLTRQVVPHTVRVKTGQWGLAVPVPEMRTLRHLTVGVVGFGRIGREVVKRLLSFGCRVWVFDPMVTKEAVASAAAGVEWKSWEDVLRGADVVSLHCPSTRETRRMMSREALATMKPGSLLVNVARGDLVDTTALVEALRSGQLAGAALDVCDPEPIPAAHPLLEFSNIILAPHIASVSVVAVRQLRETVAQLAVAALRGEMPANVVNQVSQPRRPA